MASNTVTNFLSKLLRSDKKDKSKQSFDTRRRRHSAPVPEWFDVSDAHTTSEKQQKLQPTQSKKGQKNAKDAPEQISKNVKKRKSTGAKKNKSNSKRNSAALAAWFCMSGNVDTLERTPMPPQDILRPENKGKNTFSQGKARGKENDVPCPADFMRYDDGKAKKNAKNRFSAPISGMFTAYKPADSGKEDTNEGAQNVKRERSLSPGVRYRVDGTLERPYVFPAGLTFGPEGRKTQLRRSTPKEQRLQIDDPRRHEQTIQADVHSSSREENKMEYIYEGRENALSNDQNGFDVRKAFYLKYDSNRYSMPVDPISEHSLLLYESQAERVQMDSSHDDSAVSKYRIKKSDTERESYRERERMKQERRGRAKNRYSMPPKNEDCIYMGSFENVHIGKSSEKEASLTGSERSSKRGSKKDRRNRYSMPVKNSDLVYMGSLENVNQLLSGDGGTSVDAFVTEECHIDASVSHDESTASDMARNTDTSHESQDSPDLRKRSSGRRSMRLENHRRSMPELTFQNQLSVARSTKSEGQTDSDDVNEEDDFLDDTLHIESRRQPTSTSPFSRNTGRSSCMPGNKRFVPPPPCADPSLSLYEGITSFSSNTEDSPFSRNAGRSSCNPGNKRFVSPPPSIDTQMKRTPYSRKEKRSPSATFENRRFNIPPPPNYTPPKEEMEQVQAHLLSHKGSQADLSVDFESLNMEDRDMSLKRTDAKTIFAAISTLSATEAEPSDNLKALTDFPVSKQSAPQPNIADISQGSDEVFRDTSLSEIVHTEVIQDSQSSASTKSEEAQPETDDSPPVSYNSSLPQSHTGETSLVFHEAMIIENQTNTSTCETNRESEKVAVTSTPKTGRRPKHAHSTNLDTKGTTGERPVPVPRKRYSTLGLTSVDTSKKELELAETQPQSPSNRTPPVPKKRRNLSRSQSSTAVPGASQDSTLGLTRDSSAQTDHNRKASENSNSLEKQSNGNPYDNAKACEYKDSSNDDSNIYDEIDDNAVNSFISSNNDESIYEDCGNGDTLRRAADILPPLREMKLPSSPKPRRCAVNRAVSAIEGRSISRYSYYTGLSSSFVDLTDFIKNDTSLTEFQHDLHDDRRKHVDSDDDDSSVADDEMSASNDDYLDDDMNKRQSLRKCVSADDLLRSGSIVDRSMIMARKRRQRMRSRKCKSHMFSSADTDDGGEFSYLHHHLDTARHPECRYQRDRDGSSSSRKRYNKPKHSHNDSGHDSDMISPCTSPDAKRHLDNMTRSHHGVDPIFDDDLDSCAPRQGTLTKKPWEIRLQNMQFLRKSRSRENMFASTSRLETISKSRFETLV